MVMFLSVVPNKTALEFSTLLIRQNCPLVILNLLGHNLSAPQEQGQSHQLAVQTE